MTDDTAPDLAGLCADVAAELDEATSSADEGVTSYARGTAVFARVSGTALHVRLPVDIAEAALRTPDTAVDPTTAAGCASPPATPSGTSSTEPVPGSRSPTGTPAIASLAPARGW